jgi:hypothetical protein
MERKRIRSSLQRRKRWRGRKGRGGRGGEKG